MGKGKKTIHKLAQLMDTIRVKIKERMNQKLEPLIEDYEREFYRKYNEYPPEHKKKAYQLEIIRNYTLKYFFIVLFVFIVIVLVT